MGNENSTQHSEVQKVKTTVSKIFEKNKQLEWTIENFDVLSKMSSLDYAQRFGPFNEGISIKLSIVKDEGRLVLHVRVEPTTYVVWVNLRFQLPGNEPTDFEISGDPREQPISIFKYPLTIPSELKHLKLTFVPEVLVVRTEVLECEPQLIDFNEETTPIDANSTTNSFSSPQPNARPSQSEASTRNAAASQPQTFHELITRVVAPSLNTAAHCATEILHNYSAYHTIQTLSNAEQTRESLNACRDRLNRFVVHANSHAEQAAEFLETFARHVSASRGETNSERIREAVSSILEHYQTQPQRPPVPPRQNAPAEPQNPTPESEITEPTPNATAETDHEVEEMVVEQPQAQEPTAPQPTALQPNAPAAPLSDRDSSVRSSFEDLFHETRRPEPTYSTTNPIYPIKALQTMFPRSPWPSRLRAATEPDWSFVFESKNLTGFLRHVKHHNHSAAGRRINADREWCLPNGQSLHVELVYALHPEAPFICTFKEDPPVDMAFVQTLIDGNGREIHRIDSFSDSFRGFSADQLLESAAVDTLVRVRIDAIPSMD